MRINALALIIISTISSPLLGAPKAGEKPSVVVPKDSEAYRAHLDLVKDAEAGDAKAQCSLGLIYQRGSVKLGVVKDAETGEKWFIKSAKQGNTLAFSHLYTLHVDRARALVAKGLSDSDEVAEQVKWYVLLSGRAEYKVSNRTISRETKAEGEARAKTFRDENGLKVKQ
jgi:TPR repeat protein